MNIAQSNRSCPQCQQPLPPDAPEGLCPECLMLGGLETMPLPENLKPSGRLPELGEIFGGYRIERELGRGGMGAVFEAEQLETGRRVALKLLNHQLDSPEARARFLREGRLAASINHPNSVYVFGTEEIGDMPAIAMELVGGGTLEERVRGAGPLPVAEAVDTILQVIDGLEAAQEVGILHRDVKPGNCFQDIDGTVKVGDFGLSISTEARDEKHLTMDGTIFGTPAFASPEQLRGDELNVRSDVYAVGATLYYLLTGRPAFRGKSVAQLFANVLEGTAPSPREIRPEIPTSLAAAVLRCLEKAPSERFQSYAELRRVLMPFGPEAPIPAPIPLRFVAGGVDCILYILAATGVQSLFLGGFPFPEPQDFSTYRIAMVVGLAACILYFTLLEGRPGFSIGKWFCRIRVVGLDGNPPGYLKAGLRAAAYILVPMLPLIAASGRDPYSFAGGGRLISHLITWSYFGILALVFVTARRRNWSASIFDLMTKTRVIRRKTFNERPGWMGEAVEPVTTDDENSKIGPYHVLEVLEEGAENTWAVGYDARLLRKIWIRTVPPGTAPISPELRQLGRVGRLRWLSGRRSDEENWDAFESPGGHSFLSLVEAKRPPWSSVRFWLLDLAEELEAAEADDTVPENLSLDRIWITGGGRAKLLDFSVGGDSDGNSANQVVNAAALIAKVAAVAAPPLPVHAVKFCETLSPSATPSVLVAAVKPLINRVATVTRLRRVALVAGCFAFPLMIGLMMFMGAHFAAKMNEDQSEFMQLNQVLYHRTWMKNPLMKHQKAPDDRLFAIYIASHFRDTISDPLIWDSLMARSMFTGEKRRFSEQSIADYPNPTAQEIQQADTEVGPIVDAIEDNMFMEPWFPLFVTAVGVLFYVGLPAMLLAVICRGGLVMLLCGVAVARTDGRRPSRLRCLWRSLVTWSPWLAGLFSVALLVPLIGVIGASIAASVLTVGFVVVSLWLPERSLQDRLSGTCLVTR